MLKKRMTMRRRMTAAMMIFIFGLGFLQLFSFLVGIRPRSPHPIFYSGI